MTRIPESVDGAAKTFGTSTANTPMALPPSAASGGPLSTPRREDLLAQLEAANRWGRGLILAQLAGVVLLGLFIDWKAVLQQPLTSTVASLAIVGPFAMSILRFWAQNKKEIGDL